MAFGVHSRPILAVSGRSRSDVRPVTFPVAHPHPERGMSGPEKIPEPGPARDRLVGESLFPA